MISTSNNSTLEKLSADKGGEFGSASLSGVLTNTADRLKTVKGYQTEETYQAVVGVVTVNGQQFETLLSEGSFNLSREDQIAYAESLGYRLATREEHRAYLESLIEKENTGTISQPEKNALQTYRERSMRDDLGGFDVDGDTVYAYGYVWHVDGPSNGALFVRLSVEAPTAYQKFDAISLKITINGQPFDVAVPSETIGKSPEIQSAIAEEIGGRIATRSQSEVVANYLLDREAFYLLAEDKTGEITEDQQELLNLHRDNWNEDKEAESRAKTAGRITHKETFVLEIYRGEWVRDAEGGLSVDGASVQNVDSNYARIAPVCGALIVRPAAE